MEVGWKTRIHTEQEKIWWNLSGDRKPSPNVQDETDSEIRVIWRTDDGNEIQKLSGNHAEALETLVLRIAEEAYATSNLETE